MPDLLLLLTIWYLLLGCGVAMLHLIFLPQEVWVEIFSNPRRGWLYLFIGCVTSTVLWPIALYDLIVGID